MYLSNRNDRFVREKEVDVKKVVAETLRQRGFGTSDGDQAMDES